MAPRFRNTAIMKLSDIASALDATLENGNPETEITGVAGIEEAASGQITFVANSTYAAAAKITSASAVIVSQDFLLFRPACCAAKTRISPLRGRLICFIKLRDMKLACILQL